MTTPPYTCVLFDVDNTLADTDLLIRKALRDCGCQDVESVTPRELRSLSPNHLLARLGRSGASTAYWRFYKAAITTTRLLLDHSIPEVLARMRKRGVSLGLVTSGRKDVTASVLEACGIHEYFADCFVTYGSCTRRKPHPDPLIKALQILGQNPEVAIYVGDSPTDAEASQSANVAFALAAWARSVEPCLQEWKPQVILNSATELLRYI